MSIILSILSGILLALAFPKFNLYWLAWVALIPFFIALIKSKNLKDSLVCTLFFGISFFGIHLFWVNTLFRFVKWWIVFGWLSLTLYQTLFILLFVLLLYYLAKPKKVGYAGIVALLWVAIEWLRAWGPFGVTGGDLGYSQVHMLPLIQIASFTSVYGVSFLLVLFNVAAAQFMLDRKRWKTFLLSLILILVAVVYGYFVMGQNVDQAGPGIKFSIIQPNIAQEDKLNTAKVLSTFELQEKLSNCAAQDKPDIIIWPETAVFSYLLRDSHLLPRIKQLARDTQAWLVFGTPHYSDGKAYNSIVSMSPQGEIISRYDKQHRVPFGEYLPFRAMLYPLLKRVGYYETEFSSNPNPNSLKVGDLNIAAAICFESTFPGLIKQRVKQDSDFILLLTNNAWFNDSSALYFHLNAGIFRAVENRRYFIQVGNTGISAVIDPYGRVLYQSKTNQQEVLTFKIPLS